MNTTFSSKLRRATGLALLLVSCASALACGHSFEAKTPPGFVELDEENPSHAYRATTADGLVVAVREIAHDPKGELSFWTRAIENELRQRGGYALLATLDVKTRSGLVGKELRFGHDEGAKPHEYRVTVFVTEDKLYLLEVGGTKALVASHAKDLDEYVASFRLK